METNGLSVYNVATSLDLDALTHGGSQNNNQHDEDDSDEGEEEEIQQRNAELRNLLTNAFDDLIEEEDGDLDATQDHLSKLSVNQSQEIRADTSKYNSSKAHGYAGNSLFSPLHQDKEDDLSETQYHGVDNSGPSNNTSFNSWAQSSHKKNCVRFSPIEENTTKAYRQQWNYNVEDVSEKHYLSSGLNSQDEMETLYAARGKEISKLTAEIHQLQHSVAILEGEKTGMKMTLEASEKVLQENREENRRLREEVNVLKQRLNEVTETNQSLNNKLEAAENNTIRLERQLLDLNLLQSNHRDSNRQDVLLGGIKARYENDLRTLRDELNRLRTELDCKNESVSVLERKLRDVTEMHERSLTERAANLQEFNRALDQQRMLREQRDTLTSATLLDQLSRAQEEIERLKKERVSQTLSDSMTQMRLGSSKDHRDAKQNERIISSLEQRLQTSERTIKQLEEKISQVQHEKEILGDELAKTKTQPSEKDKLNAELDNVKELYLAVCREKDSLEDQLQKLGSDRNELEGEKNHLLRELEDTNKNMEENLNRHKAMVEANWDAKLQTLIQEQVARARLEWLKEKTTGQSDDLVHVEKSLGELQCLRESMDALRHERDVLQNELIKRQQQLKLERHLLREKFEVEKQMLIKTWQEKVSASQTLTDKAENQPPEKALITATADAMARLRQQCEEEKLSIIAGYEKQILELQSNSSTPQTSQIGSSARSAQAALDWRLDLSKIKMYLKSNQLPSADLLPSLDNAILKIETLLFHDQKVIQEHSDKYKQLKRRVRDYQKYVNDKLAKNKADRQRSEDYCRMVISDLLARVTHELELLEENRVNLNQPSNNVDRPANKVRPSSSTPVNPVGLHPPPDGSTFAQGIDDLQQQVNMYIRGLTNFNK